MNRRVAMAAVAACAAAAIGAAGTMAASTAGVRLHLPAASAGTRTVHFAGVLTFTAPPGWTRRAVGKGANPTSEADFNVSIATGCKAIAFVSPAATASSGTARTQLAGSLPGSSQPGTPVPQAVRVVEAAARAHAGAWEIVTPPAPTDGGTSWSYYGGLLLPVAHARWAGLTVGLTARPSTCREQVLHDHAARTALTRLLRTAALAGVTASG